MPAIEAVLFDLGGVLFHFDHRRRLAALAAATGQLEEVLQSALWDSGFDSDCDRGHYDAAAARRKACDLIGRDMADRDIDAAMTSAFSPNLPVLELVDRLRPEVRIAVLTNNGPLVKQGLLEAHGEVLEGFGERLFFSADLGFAKPHRRAFETAAAWLGAEPGSVLFVDDSVQHIEAARELGFRVHHYREADTLGALLRTLRLLRF